MSSTVATIDVAPKRALVKRNRRIAYLFLLPNAIGFLLFTFGPVVFALVLSFVSWDGANPPEWVGMRNIVRLFGDTGFLISLRNTVIYTATVVPGTVALALFLAVVLNNGVRRGLTFFRAVHFFPHIASIVAVSVVWQFLFHAEIGPINAFLRFLGIENPPRWTASTTWALPSVIIVNIWRLQGRYMVMYLAGLQTIPSQLYEAATIDGAGGWQKFRFITVPMLNPTTFLVVVMCVINSFKVFSTVFIMTEGGPGRATTVLVYSIYTEAFINYRFGYASAISMVLFAMIMAVTLVQFRAQERHNRFVD